MTLEALELDPASLGFAGAGAEMLVDSEETEEDEDEIDEAKDEEEVDDTDETDDVDDSSDAEEAAAEEGIWMSDETDDEASSDDGAAEEAAGTTLEDSEEELGSSGAAGRRGSRRREERWLEEDAGASKCAISQLWRPVERPWIIEAGQACGRGLAGATSPRAEPTTNATTPTRIGCFAFFQSVCMFVSTSNYYTT